jgi:4'-phosphopantetheinyl transferase
MHPFAFPEDCRLADDEAHVWYLFTGGLEPETVDKCGELLSADERARAGRFTAPGKREEFQVARALLRAALSACAPAVRPEAWVFGAGAHGKPELAGPEGAPRPAFNVSHCAGLVACAVTTWPEIGVDAEYRGRRTDLDQVAQGVFSPAELEDFRGQPSGAERRRRFFEYWTLKEAYIKARGGGLSIPLDRFTIQPAVRERIGVAFDPSFGDTAGLWSFRLFEPGPGHQLALAVRAPTEGRTLRVLAREV